MMSTTYSSTNLNFWGSLTWRDYPASTTFDESASSEELGSPPPLHKKSFWLEFQLVDAR